MRSTAKKLVDRVKPLFIIKKKSQGYTANKNGQKLEHKVQYFLEDQGFVTIPYSQISTKKYVELFENSKDVLLTNVPYINVYGSKNSRSEFVLCSERLGDAIRIECRSQMSRGSVDEKMPYLFENCLAFDEKTVIVILEGSGYKDGAKQWFIDKCNSVKTKDILVMDLEGFKEWIK